MGKINGDNNNDDDDNDGRIDIDVWGVPLAEPPDRLPPRL